VSLFAKHDKFFDLVDLAAPGTGIVDDGSNTATIGVALGVGAVVLIAGGFAVKKLMQKKQSSLDVPYHDAPEAGDDDDVHVVVNPMLLHSNKSMQDRVAKLESDNADLRDGTKKFQ
jgi:hypothetical protein